MRPVISTRLESATTTNVRVVLVRFSDSVREAVYMSSKVLAGLRSNMDDRAWSVREAPMPLSNELVFPEIYSSFEEEMSDPTDEIILNDSK